MLSLEADESGTESAAESGAEAGAESGAESVNVFGLNPLMYWVWSMCIQCAVLNVIISRFL